MRNQPGAVPTVFGIDRQTVAKMMAFSVPPGYRRSGPPRRPKLEAFTGIIDRIDPRDDQGSRREPGVVPLSKTSAELLFEVFSRRYERRATLVTSNLPFDEWTEVFGSERLAGPWHVE